MTPEAYDDTRPRRAGASRVDDAARGARAAGAAPRAAWRGHPHAPGAGYAE
jgi:hypothetical protein